MNSHKVCVACVCCIENAYANEPRVSVYVCVNCVVYMYIDAYNFVMFTVPGQHRLVAWAYTHTGIYILSAEYTHI